MKIVYHPSYFAETAETSMRKLPIVAEAVREKQPREFHSPEPVTREQLLKIHGKAYVDAILIGEGDLVFEIQESEDMVNPGKEYGEAESGG